MKHSRTNSSRTYNIASQLCIWELVWNTMPSVCVWEHVQNTTPPF